MYDTKVYDMIRLSPRSNGLIRPFDGPGGWVWDFQLRMSGNLDNCHVQYDLSASRPRTLFHVVFPDTLNPERRLDDPVYRNTELPRHYVKKATGLEIRLNKGCWQ